MSPYNYPFMRLITNLVHLFGGAGGCGCNIPLLELVVGHGCIVWLEITLNIIEPTHFMHMLYCILCYLVYSK